MNDLFEKCFRWASAGKQTLVSTGKWICIISERIWTDCNDRRFNGEIESPYMKVNWEILLNFTSLQRSDENKETKSQRLNITKAEFPPKLYVSWELQRALCYMTLLSGPQVTEHTFPARLPVDAQWKEKGAKYIQLLKLMFSSDTYHFYLHFIDQRNLYGYS